MLTQCGQREDCDAGCIVAAVAVLLSGRLRILKLDG